MAYYIKRNGQYADLDREAWEDDCHRATGFETVPGAQEYITHLGLENATVVKH